MDTPQSILPDAGILPGPLTPEKVRRARERVDLSQLPDPIEELIKARDAGYREV